MWTPHHLSSLLYPSKQLRSELKQVDSRPLGGNATERPRLSGIGSVPPFWIVRLPAFQHCDHDGEQTVGNAAKRSSMFVAGRAETSIVEAAEKIMLNAASRSVMHSIAEALAAATTHDNLLALAALPGHQRDPAVGAPGIVVPLAPSSGLWPPGKGTLTPFRDRHRERPNVPVARSPQEVHPRLGLSVNLKSASLVRVNVIHPEIR